MNAAILEFLRERQRDYLPGVLDFSFDAPDAGVITGRFTVEKKHMAQNGYMHAGTAVSFADTACGYGTMVNLPDGAELFTTVELKSNFLGTAKVGDTVEVTARLVHGGRTTQVWDATVATGGHTISLFRCTQMLIYPKQAKT